MNGYYDPNTIAIEYDRTIRPSLSRRFGAWLLGRSFIDTVLPAWLFFIASLLFLAVRAWFAVSFWEASGNSPLALESIGMFYDGAVTDLPQTFAASFIYLFQTPFTTQVVEQVMSALQPLMDTSGMVSMVSSESLVKLAVCASVILPFLLIVGLGGRFAALAMAFIAGVTYFGDPSLFAGSSGTAPAEVVSELLFWLGTGSMLFVFGTGWFSWDFGLRQKLAKL